MACDQPFFVFAKTGERVPVPCGRCPPCKKRRVDSWVFRLTKEYERHDHAHFVTLTYEICPRSPNGLATLRKKDFQDYMKRLRKSISGSNKSHVKYYAVGEYGSLRHRPHYHAIIFGVEDEEKIRTAWSFGNVHIGTVTSDSMAYCMKYTDKPKEARKHKRDDRVREFSLSSQGLGSNYMTPAILNYHRADIRRNYITKRGGEKIPLPRYYRTKIYNAAQISSQLSIIQDAIRIRDAQHERYVHLHYSNSISFEQYKGIQRHFRDVDQQRRSKKKREI